MAGVYTGTFYKLTYPTNNYIKDVVYINANASISDNTLQIVDCTDSTKSTDFLISPDMHLTRYHIQAKGNFLHGFKWVHKGSD